MLNFMSARVLGGIGGAALQLKPLNKAARPNPVTGRYNQVAYCSVLSPGGRGDPKMEKKDSKTPSDVITETYGEGYGTRCDEEGFGGIYGGNAHDDADDKPGSTHADVMSETYGEGYGTRCDEEGFGGIYGGNGPDDADDKPGSHKLHAEYDKSQGCEVKEKEKARNQRSVHAA